MPQYRNSRVEVDMPDPVYYNFRNLDLKLLADRLKTFGSWNKQLSAELLASAGFYYTGISDIVRCFRCNVEGQDWVEGDNPLEDHKTWSPNCEFIANHTPESIDNLLEYLSIGLRSYIAKSVQNTEELFEFKKLNIITNKKPRYNKYTHLEVRLQTFKTWPENLTQKGKILAEAGFYYTGIKDKVLCFHCGGGLNDWDESDDPWLEHAFWFPNCQYLKIMKGATFIKTVTEKRIPKTDTKTNEQKNESLEFAMKNQKSDLCVDKIELKLANTKIEETKTDNTCKICYTNDLGLLFLPCGHIVTCTSCGSAMDYCAICREPINAVVRAFLS